jgi:SAM-dependent methyltransferase
MIKARNLIPKFISHKLWGQRHKWGKNPNEKDPEWLEWQKIQYDFYESNQRKGIGSIVNDSGYSVMSQVDLEGKCVLEFGPGDIRHHKFWNSKPSKYLIADIHEGMMNAAISIFKKDKINFESFLIKRNEKLPLAKNSVDVIVSFYSLEHLYPLESYLDEMEYYLKPNGIIAGAIPAEGGLLWAMGRFFTSRRWLHKNTNINYDKLICWEHPNYADYIIDNLDQRFQRVFLKSWPFRFFPMLDCNLTFRFCYKNCIK